LAQKDAGESAVGLDRRVFEVLLAQLALLVARDVLVPWAPLVLLDRPEILASKAGEGQEALPESLVDLVAVVLEGSLAPVEVEVCQGQLAVAVQRDRVAALVNLAPWAQLASQAAMAAGVRPVVAG